jgi:hypothetical protein
VDRLAGLGSGFGVVARGHDARDERLRGGEVVFRRRGGRRGRRRERHAQQGREHPPEPSRSHDDAT